MVVENYFDWYDLFVNQIVGSPIVFMILALIIISYIAGKARFPNGVTIMMLSLFVLMMTPFFGNGFLALVILIVTAFFGWQLSRFISRG